METMRLYTIFSPFASKKRRNCYFFHDFNGMPGIWEYIDYFIG